MARVTPGGLDALMWACTSASFVYGHEGVRRQAEQLAAAAGVPAASTSQAFVAALAALRSSAHAPRRSRSVNG